MDKETKAILDPLDKLVQEVSFVKLLRPIFKWIEAHIKESMDDRIFDRNNIGEIILILYEQIFLD